MNAISCFGRRACFLTTCALAVGLVASASAQTVLVDFGIDTSYRGLTVPDPDLNGNYWNSMQPGTPALNMVDVDNASTTIDLYFDTPVGTDSYNGPAGPTDTMGETVEWHLQFVDVDEEVLGNLAAPQAVFDYAAGPGGSDGNKARFQLQGLHPAQTYDLTFFGSHSFSDNATTVYSIYSDNTYSTVVASATLDLHGVDFTFPNTNKVATINGIAPQTGNILYVEFVGSTGGLGYLNCFRIESEPAPILVGDYSNNGTVDAADFTVWRDNLGTSNLLPNDPVGGTINITQYNNWKDNFATGGAGSSGDGLGAGSVVPEPGTMLLFVLASVGAAFVRSRR